VNVSFNSFLLAATLALFVSVQASFLPWRSAPQTGANSAQPQAANQASRMIATIAGDTVASVPSSSQVFDTTLFDHQTRKAEKGSRRSPFRYFYSVVSEAR